MEDTKLFLEELPDDTKRMVNQAAEKGASNWLAVLPVDEHGFYLHKTAFRDAICLRFGWKPGRLPEKCVCGSSFTVEHALTYNCEGLPIRLPLEFCIFAKRLFYEKKNLF